MTRPVMAMVRALSTLVASLIAFCAGFIASGSFYDHHYYPATAKQYSHDGQIGLEAFVYASSFGVALAAVAFIAGAIWTWKAFRPRHSAPPTTLVPET